MAKIKSLYGFLASITLLSAAVFPSKVAAAQDPPSSAVMSASPDDSALENNSDKEALQALAASYEARLEAMEISNRTFDRAVQVGSWLGIVLTALAVIFSFLFGRNLSELQATARRAAESAVEDAIRKTNEDYSSLGRVIEKVEETSQKLREIEEELTGYTALANVAKSASGFDPLLGYYSINREIDKRYLSTIRMVVNEGSDIDITETTHSPEFRQRAALTFERLLEDVRQNMESNLVKIGPDTLFNIAASASRIDMDFVALELMEVAEKLSHGGAPEITSRLIRQRLALSAINESEAREQISAVLGRTNGFNLHLVVSEAFNIGLRIADPSGIADLIVASLSEELSQISYTNFVLSRLKFMASDSKEWDVGERLFLCGLERFSSESSTTRWYSSSCEEIGRCISEQPWFLVKYLTQLKSSIGKWESLRAFEQRYGMTLTTSLMQLNALGEFLADD